MTALARRIRRLIETNGPLGVAEYMAICLFDPKHGYYTTREPFGAKGDFTTAPEISQMFGELVGVWIHLAWEALGSPDPVTIAEIGPGRGTLMADILRTLRTLSPALHGCASVSLVETSPRLVAIQKATLSAQRKPASWHETIGMLARQPLIVVGNELFDAVPVRQYVHTTHGWRERCIVLNANARFAFGAGAGSVDPDLLPPDSGDAPEGAIVELAPARSALMQSIAERVAADGGAGLFIDYGYARPAVGDTLQALSKHQYDDPLAHPGEADLTAHVDFAALAGVVHGVGLNTALLGQGEFLLGLGLLERAGRLGATADAVRRQAIRQEVDRLAGEQGMGHLFKAFALLPKGVAVAPFARPGP